MSYPKMPLREIGLRYLGRQKSCQPSLQCRHDLAHGWLTQDQWPAMRHRHSILKHQWSERMAATGLCVSQTREQGRGDM